PISKRGIRPPMRVILRALRALPTTPCRWPPCFHTTSARKGFAARRSKTAKAFSARAAYSASGPTAQSGVGWPSWRCAQQARLQSMQRRGASRGRRASLGAHASAHGDAQTFEQLRLRQRAAIVAKHNGRGVAFFEAHALETALRLRRALLQAAPCNE